MLPTFEMMIKDSLTISIKKIINIPTILNIVIQREIAAFG